MKNLLFLFKVFHTYILRHTVNVTSQRYAFSCLQDHVISIECVYPVHINDVASVAPQIILPKEKCDVTELPVYRYFFCNDSSVSPGNDVKNHLPTILLYVYDPFHIDEPRSVFI